MKIYENFSKRGIEKPEIRMTPPVHNRSLKRGVPACIPLFVFLLICGGCDMLTGTAPEEGNITIHLNSGTGAGRSMTKPPDDTQAAMDYSLVFTGPEGVTFTREVPAGTPSVRLSLALGQWTVTAAARMPGGVTVGTGSETFTVRGGNNQVTIHMAAVGGGLFYEIAIDPAVTNGSISGPFSHAFTGVTVTLTASPDAGTVLIGISAVEKGTTITVPLGATISGNTATFAMPPQDITVSAAFGPYVMVDKTPGAKDLKTRFNITAAGTAGVTAAFTALHYLITAPNSGDNYLTDLTLGDWIDLDSLTVTQDTFNLGEISATNTDLGEHGKLLRLIVVGINSFSGINGNSTPHVVFQFQNIPGTRRMEATNTNTNGYLGSEMRSYLTGNFRAGLVNAGVPAAHLWAPSRRVANKGSGASAADTVADEVWLPTEYEMFGANPQSSTTYEAAGTQASFTGYYTTDASRIKYNSTNAAAYYWEASPLSASAADFCNVDTSGGFAGGFASVVEGCAPAFCIK